MGGGCDCSYWEQSFIQPKWLKSNPDVKFDINVLKEWFFAHNGNDRVRHFNLFQDAMGMIKRVDNFTVYADIGIVDTIRNNTDKVARERAERHGLYQDSRTYPDFYAEKIRRLR